jgi:acetyltransferase-like isoleucine patch superfamily enzyme
MLIYKIMLLVKLLFRYFSSRIAFKNESRQKILRPSILDEIATKLMTDDERAEFLGLPKSCRVRVSAKIISPEKLVCGENVWIGENTLVDASGGLRIGAHTAVSVGVMIWTHSSVLSSLLRDNRSGNSWIKRDSTEIGEGCYLGGPSSIYAGVTIGDGAVVLPMSVVTNDVPAGAIVAGSPAKIIGQADQEWIENLKKKL